MGWRGAGFVAWGEEPCIGNMIICPAKRQARSCVWLVTGSYYSSTASNRRGTAAEKMPVSAFEAEGGGDWTGPIDARVLAALQRHGIEPAGLCSDAVFVRRVFLDLIGTLPQPAELRTFRDDRRPDKRLHLVDALLEREEYADYWALKWCDVLRVKSEFPINLWPNAVQAYHRWVREAIRMDLPWDAFARELLTSSGSNFRVPAVNFYRAVQGREPAVIAQAVALTFMGTRIEHWPAQRRTQLAVFFSRIAYKATTEWKEEIVHLDPTPAEPFEAMLPDGRSVHIGPEQDPRRVFADWLIDADNPYFARNIANRLWAWLLGRGVVHECDDIRPDNPPSNPELLAVLAEELVKARYDLKAMYRLICGSRTYQQSAIPRSEHPEAGALFACYPVRRLDAEVLIDALCMLFGGSESYVSLIPEPFTFIPERQRTITLADGSISSPFLEMFGRPARDTGLVSERNNAPTDAQRLHLLNSTQIQRMIETSPRVRQWIAAARGNRPELIRSAYVNLLSRYPTPEELADADGYLQTRGLRLEQTANDLVWALVNSKEFLYRH